MGIRFRCSTRFISVWKDWLRPLGRIPYPNIHLPSSRCVWCCAGHGIIVWCILSVDMVYWPALGVYRTQFEAPATHSLVPTPHTQMVAHYELRAVLIQTIFSPPPASIQPRPRRFFFDSLSIRFVVAFGDCRCQLGMCAAHFRRCRIFGCGFWGFPFTLICACAECDESEYAKTTNERRICEWIMHRIKLD